jgi:SAM-dependent methyltransferase
MATKNRPAERGSGSPAVGKGGADLPAYAATLAAFHTAFTKELRRAVRAVPLRPAAEVLDVPCGDGFYTVGLARRLHPAGRIVAADLSDAYLDRARRRFARTPRLAPAEFVTADAYKLPFDDGRFDLVWCAQSLISLRDPIAALKEMRRVVRPGGAVAILEDDEFHRVLVNWPVDLELDVQRAVAEATRARYGSRTGRSPARRLIGLFRETGLRPRWKKTFAADRQAPFGPKVERFLERHLRDTQSFAAPHLSADKRAALERAADPADPQSVLRRPDAELTCLTTLFLAVR